MRLLIHIIYLFVLAPAVASDSVIEGFVDALLSDDKVFLIGSTNTLERGPVRYAKEKSMENIPYKSIEDMTIFRNEYNNNALFINESFCTDTTFAVFLFSRRVYFFENGRPVIFGRGTKWLVVAEPALEPDGSLKAKFQDRLDGVEEHIKVVPGSLFVQDEREGEDVFFLLKWVPMDGMEDGPRGNYATLDDVELKDMQLIMRSFCDWRSKGIGSLDPSDVLDLLPMLQTDIAARVVRQAAEKLAKSRLDSGISESPFEDRDG